MSEAQESDSTGGFRWWMIVPVLGAASVLTVFLLGLQRDDGGRNLPSVLIGKAAPEFSLEALYDGQPGLSTADLRQPGVKLLNIWASWCVPCRAEHPKLEELAKMGLTIHAINYKDKPEAAKQFLSQLGNPFTLIGADTSGRAGIEWGVYGVPETYIIDRSGRIRKKHVGPIFPEILEKELLPLIRELQGEGK